MHSSDDSAGMPQPINELKYLSTWTHSILWCNAECCIFVDTDSSVYRVLYICPKRLKLSLKSVRDRGRHTKRETQRNGVGGKRREPEWETEAKTGRRTDTRLSRRGSHADRPPQTQANLGASRASSSCGRHRARLRTGVEPRPAAHLQLSAAGGVWFCTPTPNKHLN